MPNIQFDYQGQTYDADVTDNFLQLTEEEQKKRLEASLATVPTEEKERSLVASFIIFLCLSVQHRLLR